MNKREVTLEFHNLATYTSTMYFLVCPVKLSKPTGYPKPTSCTSLMSDMV